MSQRKSIVAFSVVSIVLALAIGTVAPEASAKDRKKKDPSLYDVTLRTPVPLGTEAYVVEPSRRQMMLLVSVENPMFDGIHIVRDGPNSAVTRSDGTSVSTYPETIEFRVTGSAIPAELIGVDVNNIRTKRDMNSFLLGLKFRLKMFRALDMKMIPPAHVKLIGVPADQPYDERVFRVSFETHDVPVDTRMVLEIFSPDGERLARFHLELL